MKQIATLIAILLTGTIIAAQAPKKARQAAAARPNTTFAFAGDILMGTSYPDDTTLPKNGGKNLFDDCRQIFKEVDVAAANLEGVLIAKGEGKPKPCGNNSTTCFTFRMPPEYVQHLVDAGIDYMNIANNHANDFGPGGLTSTQRVLKKAGIAYSGLATQCPTAIIERNGRRIGFASFGHSRNTASINDLQLVKRTVSKLDSICDIVVVSFHGGEEGRNHTRVPFAAEHAFGERRGNVYEFAHAAVDAGADVVYGHGPHVNRAMELYRDRLIMYSLGNFCTPFRMNVSGVCGYAPIVTATLDSKGRFVEGRIHPFIQQKGVGPRKDTTGAVIKNLQQLTKLDFPNTPLVIANDGAIHKK